MDASGSVGKDSLLSVISGYGLSNLFRTLDFNTARVQDRLHTDVSRLASGLRIQTAADDPAGLAIAEGLQAQVNGHDQATSNTQTAVNALTVADGALQTVTDLLQRLRSLCVQANNDLLSDTDRSNIQTESTQLQAEIDSISQNTNFNGVHLFSDPHTAALGAPPVLDNTFTQPPTAGPIAAPAGSPWTFSVPGGFGTSGIGSVAQFQATDGIQPPPSGSAQVGYLDRFGGASFSQSITGFVPAVAYALSFNVSQSNTNVTVGGRVQQVVSVQIDGVPIATYSPIPADPFNPTWTTYTTPVFSPGSGAHTIKFEGTANGVAFIDNVQLQSYPTPTQIAALVDRGQTLTVQSGAGEGDAVTVGLATVNSANLKIATDSVSSSTNAATSESNIGSALDYVNGARAVLGAGMVSLQYQAANNTAAALNLTASESNIRDANVAQTASAFTQTQILSRIGESILGNSKNLALEVEQLFA